jgi:hypothetical protein
VEFGPAKFDPHFTGQGLRVAESRIQNPEFQTLEDSFRKL